ncbi:MAG: Cell envelope-related transcriptional attenuator [Candidatus Gottesmanbacteria bacterium GW2011_GWA1_34_13]|uniref:Cell envelope-related transcriptional attenuator n=1 Tax=Candidatus Gottesmanbacteria bacterium GW2011_GWA1_34_13 TaxID=1618434 RepID=A0A0G0ASY7_9BACT|nr:MAG: Cell envelope-related transcriptional attenuator [Candidatus Gottesmanbacteria bacterium GW2011_GWA1_34_13]
MKLKVVLKNRKILWFIAAGLFILISLILGFITLKKPQTKISNIDSVPINNQADTNTPQEIATTSAFPKDNKSMGILLLGYGGPGHDGGYLTDAIQLLYFDFINGKLNLISIPRDLWVKVPNNGETKINTVFVSGAKNNTGTQIAKQVVSEITGLPINYVIAVDFVGFQKTIGESLKGIDVEVEETLDDPWYPIKGEEQNLCGNTPEEVTKLTKELSGFELEKQFVCRYEHLHFEKGLNKMQGGEALKYVRSRHGSSEGDVSRGKRQQEVMLGIAKKLFSINALDDINGFFKTVSKNIQTDLNPQIIEFFSPGLKKANSFKISRINLSASNVLSTTTSSDRQAIFTPKEGQFNWSGIQKYIKEEINKN